MMHEMHCAELAETRELNYVGRHRLSNNWMFHHVAAADLADGCIDCEVGNLHIYCRYRSAKIRVNLNGGAFK